MKPEIVEGVSCPKCDSIDTIALSTDTKMLVWCECGTVYIMDIDRETKAITEVSVLIDKI